MRFISAAALVAAVVLVSCRPEESTSGVVLDKSLRNLIWPDATVLVGADLTALKKTGFYGRYADRLNLPLLNESSERFGFDPRKDVDRAIWESTPRQSLLLAEGRFRSKQAAAKGQDGQPGYLFLSDSLFVAGPGPALKGAQELRANKSGSVPRELQARLEQVDKDAQVWMVSSHGLPFMQMAMRSEVQSALSNIVAYISGTTASLRVTDGSNLDASMTCTSPEGAKRVHDALRGGIGLARLSTRDDQPELLRVYDAIKVEQEGSIVEVKAALTSNQVDQLLAGIPQLRKN